MVDFEIGTNAEGSSKQQITAALIASVGALALGSVLGWTAPALRSIPKSDVLGDLSQNEKSWIASSALVGAAFGYPVATVLLKRMGRRMALLSISVSLILAWIVMSCADGVVTLVSGRAISGLCAEAIIAVALIYRDEVAGKASTIVKSLYLLGIALGVLISFFFGVIVEWLWLSIYCAMIPMVYICGMVYMPETPQYFLSVGKYRDAQKSVQWLNGQIDNFEMNQDLSEMKLQLEEEGLAPTFDIHAKDIFSSSFLKPLFTAIFLVFIEQCSGICVILFYIFDIFEIFHVNDIVYDEVGLVIFGGLLVISGILSLIFSQGQDTKKDKIVLRVSYLGASACMGVLASLKYFIENDNPVSQIVSWIAFFTLSCFAISYGIGLPASSWMVVEKNTPNQYKGWISCLASSTKWICGFCVTKFFYEYYLSNSVFWVFSGLSFVGFLVSCFCLPFSNIENR